jgi:hypothetical protein
MNNIFCEEMAMITRIKYDLYQNLQEEIQAEEFKQQFKCRFYYDVILKPEFIHTFLNCIDFESIPREFYENPLLFKNMIIDNFFIYIINEQKQYNGQFLITLCRHMFAYIPIDSYIEVHKVIFAEVCFTNKSLVLQNQDMLRSVNSFEYYAIQDILKNSLAFELSYDGTFKFQLSFCKIPLVVLK